MSKVLDDIETLKKWAAWILDSPRAYAIPFHSSDKDAAKAVMNLIAYVGTLKAESAKSYTDGVKRAVEILRYQHEHCEPGTRVSYHVAAEVVQLDGVALKGSADE